MFQIIITVEVIHIALFVLCVYVFAYFLSFAKSNQIIRAIFDKLIL
jgi:hypothetical protein